MNHNQTLYCTVKLLLKLYTRLLYSQTKILNYVVEMHHLTLFYFWLSPPCNDKAANEENDVSGDDDDDGPPFVSRKKQTKEEQRDQRKGAKTKTLFSGWM